MKLMFCDRCGKGSSDGPSNRVVEVSMQPLVRRIDLCGSCRSELQPVLDKWLEELRTDAAIVSNVMAAGVIRRGRPEETA